MSADPNKLTDPTQLRNLMANARRLGRNDIVLQCQLRIAGLSGAKYDDELEREFWTAVSCAEEFKTAEKGKIIRLARTRQKHARVGTVQCLHDWAIDPKVTDGFLILLSAGRPELTGEAIVIRHPEQFGAEVVESAVAKLRAHGIDPDSVR